MLDAQKLAIITCFLSSYSLLCAKSLAYSRGARRDRSGIAKNERLHLLSSWWKGDCEGSVLLDVMMMMASEQESALFSLWTMKSGRTSTVFVLLACGNGVDDGANWQWQGSREKRTFITISSTLRYYGVRGQSILAQPALPLVNDFLGPPKGSRSTGKHWSFKTMNVVFLPLVVEEESWDLFFQSHHSSNSGHFLSQKF